MQEGIEGKLIYRYEKSIPGVVGRILEEMGFAEWDPAIHTCIRYIYIYIYIYIYVPNTCVPQWGRQ